MVICDYCKNSGSCNEQCVHNKKSMVDYFDDDGDRHRRFMWKVMRYKIKIER
jgi:hypothetical protein